MIFGYDTYYVSSADCPQCHPLSYYTNNTAAYFTSDTTFIFMEGEHLLDNEGLVQIAINSVDNLTLKGERGHCNTDIIIRCGNNTRGLLFNNTNMIAITDISITGCGQQDIPLLLFTNITSLYIHHITLYNNMYNTSSVGGILYIHCITDTHITITNSTIINNTGYGSGGGLYIHSDTDTHNSIISINNVFANNRVNGDGGGLYIYSYTDTHNNITITDSAFTNHTYGIDGGGLYIYSGTNVHNNIIITNSTFNNVIGSSGGALNIHSDKGIYNNITVTNSVFTSNTVSEYGGGMWIYSHSDIYNTITITNSAFLNNKVCVHGGGLVIFSDTDIYNNITITNGTFTSNTVCSDGGGLVIYSGSEVDNSITITNSIYNNNIVGYNGSGLLILAGYGVNSNITITNSIFANNIVDYNGGGLVMYFGSDMHNDVTVTNSTFTNNTVVNINGSGLFIHSGNTVHNIITITKSVFADNTIRKWGAGLIIYSLFDIYNDITITNCTFAKNIANVSGGGLVIYSARTNIHNNIIITSNMYTNNIVGSDGGGLFIYSETDNNNNVVITNSTFANNEVGLSGGGLVMFSYTDRIYDNITTCITNSAFIDNNGSGILLQYVTAMLSQVIVSNNNDSGIVGLYHVTATFTEGHSVVANNSSPTNGGGIYLGMDSHLATSNGGHVQFINNTSHRYGGAIYSPDNDYISLLNSIRQFYNDKCTVSSLSATFVNNSAAVAGDLLYGGVFVVCRHYWKRNIYSYLHDLIQCSNIPNSVKNATSVHPFSPVSSDPLIVCPCVNGTVDCNTKSLDREVYPGQILHVTLVTVGLCGGASPGTVVVEHEKQINLISSSTTDYTSTSCTTLNYTVRLITYNISNTKVSLTVADSDTYGIKPFNIYLTILKCPLGLVLNLLSGECVCNNDIAHVSGVICNISWMPYPIQRYGNNWLSHRHDDYNCAIAHTGCPFDYCNISYVKFNLNESDLQCNYNRSGVLCGKCIQGLSLMIGSNRCANCTDTALVSVSIFIIAAVAGIALVILLILLNLTVSVGSINGLLFYVNVVKLNESVFFSQGNIPVISQFISWCNLDVGFEYCFIHGLDGYVKTWLQFMFPVYVWVLVIAIIVGCRYSGRLSRFCGSNAVPVLATLILMSYTKLSRTVTNALMMNTLQCGEYKWNVWNVDGNIPYLGGKHILLFTVSLLFLITGLVYTGLVFSSQWLQRYSGKCCKSTRDPVVQWKPLIDAYTGPFKDRYRFWTGLCLMIRLILTVVFSFTTTQSKLNNYIILLTVVAMSMFVVGTRTYKDKRLTVLETVSFINLICLSFLTILFTDLDESLAVPINVIVSVSVSIEILLFVIIATVHCYLAFTNHCCKSRVRVPTELIHIIDDKEDAVAHAIAYREELIFDFYLNKEHP